MERQTYLDRIAYKGPCEPTAEVLKRLHRAHLHAVPFENLDIPLGRPIGLSLPTVFDKVVRRRRGGFCYELNGLFCWLLRQLGFRVEMLAGRVHGEGGLGPEFDHMLLRVGLRESWIADVGFGDSFLEPLRLVTGDQPQASGTYRLQQEGQSWELSHRSPDSGWNPQYVFDSKPRELEEFGSMCLYQQTSPESVFTRKVVCTLPERDGGRVTLARGRLITSGTGGRRERPIRGTRELRTLLAKHFEIEVDRDADLEALL